MKKAGQPIAPRPRPPTADATASTPRRTRDVTSLYCQGSTLRCATAGCVPCAYKVGTFDTALDAEFTKRVPNQRPEMCPRSNAKIEGGLNGAYRLGMKVLCVGDGDMSFALAVAGQVFDKNASGEGSVVATSYEDKATLQTVYPNFEETLKSLRSYGGVKVGYKVDATNLHASFPDGLANTTFQRICWNFPCTAISRGQDGQNAAMEENKELVRRFVSCALPYLDRTCGEIHMIHKTKPPYNHWGLEKVALEGAGSQFEFKGKIVFDRCNLPPYVPRKALDRKSFPCHDACDYVFGWSGGGSNSSIPEAGAGADDDDDDDMEPEKIVKVTTKMLERVRAIHLRNQVGAERKKHERTTRKGGQRKKRQRTK
mmetsp:Transcript_20564/g.48302  ORF Transcript_20564/g.48302 Transcript_20564/m.48302 type:complete len:370 (+) Transcript_20564:139-1248(+)